MTDDKSSKGIEEEWVRVRGVKKPKALTMALRWLLCDESLKKKKWPPLGAAFPRSDVGNGIVCYSHRTVRYNK